MGNLLGAITLNELKEYARSKEKALIIIECQYVSSYNWLDRRDATISVPGLYGRGTFKIIGPQLILSRSTTTLKSAKTTSDA